MCPKPHYNPSKCSTNQGGPRTWNGPPHFAPRLRGHGHPQAVGTPENGRTPNTRAPDPTPKPTPERPVTKSKASSRNLKHPGAYSQPPSNSSHQPNSLERQLAHSPEVHHINPQSTQGEEIREVNYVMEPIREDQRLSNSP